jgi:hypothetical protein
MDVIYKIFSNIIKERLDKWTNYFDIIDEAQVGFRSGYSVVFTSGCDSKVHFKTTR